MNDFRSLLSLDGDWYLISCPDGAGHAKGWPQGPVPEDASRCTVPGNWWSIFPSPTPVVWYFREFTWDAPSALALHELVFKGVDYRAEVWLNGARVGDHEGGYASFAFDVSALLKQGTNLLVVRVCDPPPGQSADDLDWRQCPTGSQGTFAPFSGVHAPVCIQSRPMRSVRVTAIDPDVNRRRVRVTFEAPEGCRARLSIADAEGVEAEGTGPRMTFAFPRFDEWSPNSPRLHLLIAELLDGDEVIDHFSLPFGMRELAWRNGRFLLNRESFIPRVLIVDDACARMEQARTQLTIAKTMGFNAVRLRQMGGCGPWLELCDELGFLAILEPPLKGMAPSRWLDPRCEREIKDMAARALLHPSALIYDFRACPEKVDAFGHAYIADPGRIVMTAAEWPGELTLHIPHGEDSQTIASKTLHACAMAGPGGDAILREMAAPHNSVFVTALWSLGTDDEDAQDDLLKAGEPPAILPGGPDALLTASRETHLETIAALVRRLRQNTRVAGYELEIHGDVSALSPKAILPLMTAQASPAPLVLIPMDVLETRQETAVEVFLANDGRETDRAELSLQVSGPTAQVLWRKKRGGMRLPVNTAPLWDGAIAASGAVGRHKFTAKLQNTASQTIHEDTASFHVIPESGKFDTPVKITGPASPWSAVLSRLCRNTSKRPVIHIIPPLANSIRAYPPSDMAETLAEVQEGAIAIVLNPPSDWDEFAKALNLPGDIQSVSLEGLPRLGHARLHPVFEHLPSGVMGWEYAACAPRRAMLGATEEDICGCAIETSAGFRWGNLVAVRRLGAGRLVFVTLSLIEQLDVSPMARHLLLNLARHFARRSMPADEPPGLIRPVAEWLAHERAECLRRWLVLGFFPPSANREDSLDAVHPPERAVDPAAEYPGPLGPIAWRAWHVQARDEWRCDVDRACAPEREDAIHTRSGVAYAYAEITSPSRQEAILLLSATVPGRVWMNGKVCDSPEEVTRERYSYTLCVNLKQGKNTILVKLTADGGPCDFALDLAPAGRGPLVCVWWR